MPVIFASKSKLKIHAHVPDPPPPATASASHTRLHEQIRTTRLECVEITELKANRRNAKKHPQRQIDLLAANFERFGFTQPIIIDEDGNILCGHARYLAALKCGITHLNVIRLKYLNASEKRALALADNKLAELGSYDLEILAEELDFLYDPKTDLSFDPGILGFETVEVDNILVGQSNAHASDPADNVIVPKTLVATTISNDKWICGSHVLVCGSALVEQVYEALLGKERAQIAFTDPPYNLENEGFVSGNPDVREFAMAHGEMTPDQFTAFLGGFMQRMVAYLVAGSVVYICMDWRHMQELQTAAGSVFGALKNMIVWVKTNAGMGSFYRSQHELIFVYVVPGAKPTNNFGLGAKGRYRTNVFNYPGFNSFGRGRDDALAMHPTVKPVALVADTLRDCSNRGDIVLDAFGGSGSSMIAAERTGRRARLIEIDPLYCDLIVQRWQKFSGKVARLAETNESFDEVRARRLVTSRGA